MTAEERREGPSVTTSYSCFGCKYESSEKYRVQSDSGHDVYCNHPSFPERQRVGDTNWSTPKFCPLIPKDKLTEAIEKIEAVKPSNFPNNPIVSARLVAFNEALSILNSLKTPE